MGKRKKYKNQVYQVGQWLELIISGLIALALIFYTVVLGIELFQMVTKGTMNVDDLSGYVNLAFGIVIGIEFIKMLCKHSPSIIIEVLLFAVARQMIVEHMSPLQNLISIACIAILFAIRRFLFFDHDEEIETPPCPEHVEHK